MFLRSSRIPLAILALAASLCVVAGCHECPWGPGEGEGEGEIEGMGAEGEGEIEGMLVEGEMEGMVAEGEGEGEGEMPQPGDERIVSAITFVWVPPGSFMMGSSLTADEVWTTYGGASPRDFENEHPQHEVTLTHGFWLGKYEVTQAQWIAVMGENPSFREGDSLPVEGISWNDAQAFIGALNGNTVRFRLPTEAEWEYACRAGTATPFYHGSDAASLVDYAWIIANATGADFNAVTQPVGQLLPNAWGLHDMLGNVWEFCADWYDADYYAESPALDPLGPEAGAFRVLRGGTVERTEVRARCAFRSRNDPEFSTRDQGLRIVYVP